MDKVKRIFKSWRTSFQEGACQFIHQDLKNLVANNDFSCKEEALLASWCLISLNINCKKTLETASANSQSLADLYQLCMLCCGLTSKSWTSIEGDFVTSVFYVCKSLLKQKYVTEACDISQFVFKYLDDVNDLKLDSNEMNVPSKFILLFLQATSTLDFNSEEDTKLFHLWNTILSFSEKKIMQINISTVVEYFSPFLQKITGDNFLKYKDDLSSLIRMLNRGIGINGNKEKIFFKFFRTNINKFGEFSKNSTNFFFECLDHINTEDCVGIKFCENIYRICAGSFENSGALETINTSAGLLQSLIQKDILVLDDVVYCASVIIITIQLKKLNSYLPNTAAVQNLWSILLTLAQRLYVIDIHELFVGKKEATRKIDLGSVALLATDVLSTCAQIEDLNLEDEKIFESLLEAENLAITCLKSMDEKRREQMRTFFGGSCINVCRKYLIGNLHSHCKNLGTNLLTYYSSLPANELKSSSLELYINKLVQCMCGNYRSLEMYEDWINIACVWSLITPANASIFMEQYCTAKYKLFLSNSESSYLKYSCLEILKKVRNQWKHENLETLDATQINLMELNAYLKHNLILEEPLLKLTEILEAQNIDNRFLLGHINYAKFRLKLLQFRKENENEVKTLAPNKTDPTSEENEYVLGSYTFNNQKDILMLLNTAIDYWTAAIEEFSSSKQSKNINSKLELSYLKETAFVYRQYCDSDREIQVWKLLYVASKYAKNDTSAVSAFCNLLCTSWKVNPKWKKEIEEEMIHKVDESLKLRYRIDSWSEKLAEGLTADERRSLKEITLERADALNLRAKFGFLMSRAYFYNIFDDTADSFGMSYKAMTSLVEQLKNMKWNNFAETCEIQCMLLDIFVFMVARCTEKFEFHNAKSFTREALKIVQTLGLPLRTCQILHLSAFLDTIVGNLEDCFVKLQYVSSILNHDSMPLEEAECKRGSFANDRRFVRRDYDIDFEDDPASNSELRFEMPRFASHQKKCECDVCVNPEYLKLYCELMSLYGIYFRLLKKWGQADGFFQGVFKLLRFAKKRIDIVDLKASTLIHCGNYWAAKNCLKEAHLCTRKAQDVFTTSKISNTALKDFSIDQWWQQFAVQFFNEIEKSRIVTRGEDALPKSSLRATVPSTSRKPKKVIESAPITPYPRRSRKVLLFDDFGTPPNDQAQESKEFTTPPPIVMQLPPTERKRQTKRRLKR